jgi:hypothetical protein
MTTIRSEMRVEEEGEPEIWANLGDVLDWLQTLPGLTDHRVAGAVALEIKEMLLASVTNAELVQKDAG